MHQHFSPPEADQRNEVDFYAGIVGLCWKPGCKQRKDSFANKHKKNPGKSRAFII